eukprot:1181837-Prorocentrum_minimum.AAC.2
MDRQYDESDTKHLAEVYNYCGYSSEGDGLVAGTTGLRQGPTDTGDQPTGNGASGSCVPLVPPADQRAGSDGNGNGNGWGDSREEGGHTFSGSGSCGSSRAL